MITLREHQEVQSAHSLPDSHLKSQSGLKRTLVLLHHRGTQLIPHPLGSNSSEFYKEPTDAEVVGGICVDVSTSLQAQ